MSDIKAANERSARRIGPVGAIGRALLGAVFLAVAATWERTGAVHWVVGLLGLPLATLAVMAVLRGGRPGARWTTPAGHLVNIGIGMAIFSVSPPTALVFYGAALLLAAARGYAGCELLAFSNAVLRRDDEIGCPVFSPVDAMEARSATR